jgi:beta-glucanase (GH16 family)
MSSRRNTSIARLITVSTLAGVALACGAPDEGSSPEQDGESAGMSISTNQYYYLIARHSDKALDVQSSSTANGANVQQWQRNDSAAQQWRLEDAGAGYYKLRAKCSGKVLDVQNAAYGEGANVQQWDDWNADNQKWRFEDAGGGYVRVAAKHSGKYLDVAWGANDDGANVAQVNAYSGSLAQQWRFVPVNVGGSAFEDGRYVFRSLHSGKCLDVASSSQADGANVQQWSCNGTLAQAFDVKSVGGGLYSILNAGSGKALDVRDVSYDAGARVQQWGYGGGANQKFRIEDAGDGTYRIVASHSGYVVDIASWSKEDGAAAIQWPWSGGANQRWTPSKTDGGGSGGSGSGGEPPSPSGWNLVWSDEFNGSGLPDASKWGYDVGGSGWGNGEAQYYTEARTENARVENGNLVIEARREAYGGMNYTSARLVTRNKGDWTYGRMQVRALIPSGRGTWPAIWMLPTDWQYGGWPDSGEIDIMEHVGFDVNNVHGTVHTKAYNHMIGTQKGATTWVGDATTAFHDYVVEWTPDRIDFYVDSNRYYSFANEGTGSAAWPFDKRFHLILNIAVGGSWGGVQGIDDGAFPQRMLVDYVRVYTKN